MRALLVDIGNTRIKWRVIDPTLPARTGESLDEAWRGTAGALPLAEADRLAKHLRAGPVEDVEAAWISNVASAGVEAIVGEALDATWHGIRVEVVQATASRCGVVNSYADPARLGSDRWLAMIGGHALMPDRSLLICSFGTATTIDLIVPIDTPPTGRMRFVGGSILPGVDTMRRSLADGTARLTSEPGEVVPFADNTADAIASGIIGAQIGAVERAWRDARALAVGDGLDCVVAGGSATGIVPTLSAAGIPHRVVPDLVLRGLAVVAREVG